MTTSSVRITNECGADVTPEYVNLYRITAGPLTQLEQGNANALAMSLLMAARRGRPGGEGRALPKDQYENVLLLSEAGEGEFTTGSGWTITVTPDEMPLADGAPDPVDEDR